MSILGSLCPLWAVSPGDLWDEDTPKSVLVPFEGGYAALCCQDNKLRVYFLDSDKKVLPLGYSQGIAALDYVVKRSVGQGTVMVPLQPVADGTALETVRPLHTPLQYYVRLGLVAKPLHVQDLKSSEPAEDAQDQTLSQQEAPARSYLPRTRIDW